MCRVATTAAKSLAELGTCTEGGDREQLDEPVFLQNTGVS
ncbi:unnamed protein product [Staurois parvus]|uniref:Uncharacterized protein n=1 Tax=Staurois parvus TaxID=386267 RepID=A0ABN9FGZ4_9NEOB|nr:unnamed protein product [Staurois parvus]